MSPLISCRESNCGTKHLLWDRIKMIERCHHVDIDLSRGYITHTQLRVIREEFEISIFFSF